MIGGFLMKNVEMKKTGNKLVITVDLSKEFGMSSSGKSIIISSTEGNVTVAGTDGVKIGLNVYKRNK
jgi:hypothetical protein